MVSVPAALRPNAVTGARLPALAVCHGQVIRLALTQRPGRALPAGERVKNGELVALAAPAAS